MSAQFQLLEFTTDTKTYSQAGDIYRDEKVLGYHIINTGTVIAYINNTILYPSGVLDTMYSGYKDKSKYSIKFDTTVQPVLDPEITVITFNQV